VASIPACHAGDRGSIPRVGAVDFWNMISARTSIGRPVFNVEQNMVVTFLNEGAGQASFHFTVEKNKV
jgi:hypothetical protein